MAGWLTFSDPVAQTARVDVVLVYIGGWDRKSCDLVASDQVDAPVHNLFAGSM